MSQNLRCSVSDVPAPCFICLRREKKEEKKEEEKEEGRREMRTEGEERKRKKLT